MTARPSMFLTEPDEWAPGDEERLRGLIGGSNSTCTDHEAVIALLELLHDEVTEIGAEDCGFLGRSQLAIAFDALFAAVRRLGWTQLSSLPGE